MTAMMKIKIAAAAASALLSLAAAMPASALTFNFTYSGTNTTNGAFTASGTLTTSNTTVTTSFGQAYTITGITGTRNGSAITGLIPAGTDFGGVPIDNYLLASTTSQRLTDSGFGFSVAGTTNLFNPYYFGGAYQEYVRTAAGADFQNTSGITFTVTPAATAVPEPATWGMMILGFGLTSFGLRRAKRRSDVKFDARIKRIAAGLQA
jgi:hypothetical protein